MRRNSLIALFFMLTALSVFALPGDMAIDFGLYYPRNDVGIYKPLYVQHEDLVGYGLIGEEPYSNIPVYLHMSAEKGLLCFGLGFLEHYFLIDSGVGNYLEVGPFIGLSSRNMIFSAVDVDVGIGPALSWLYASIPDFRPEFVTDESNSINVNVAPLAIFHFVKVDILLYKALHASVMMRNNSVLSGWGGTESRLQVSSVPTFCFGLSFSVE